MMAPDAEVIIDHKPVALSTLWKEKPAVLLFLRHLG